MSGLLALLDDVAAIAKVAASSIDDIAGQAAKAGAHIATMPYAVFQRMFKHPLTDVGMQRFLEDARRAAKVRG